MSNHPEKQDTQTPEDLGKGLATQLAEIVPPELRRRTEPQINFSIGLAWRQAERNHSS